MTRYLIVFGFSLVLTGGLGCGPRNAETAENISNTSRRLTLEGCPMEYESLSRPGGAQQQYAIVEGDINGEAVLGFPDGFGTGELAGYLLYHEYLDPVTMTISACTTESCVDLLRNWAGASTSTTRPTVPWDYVITTPPLFLCDKSGEDVVIKSSPDETTRSTLLVGYEHLGSPYAFTITGEGAIDYTIKAWPVWLE